MDYIIIQPSAILRPYVRHYWILMLGSHDLPYSQHLLPFGRMELFFYLHPISILNTCSSNTYGINENYKVGSGFFSGFFNQSLTINYTVPVRMAGISFQPWAGNVIFQTPANNFTNRLTAFSDIDSSTDLSRRLPELIGEDEIMKCFEDYLINRVKDRKMDEVSSYLSQKIMKASFTRGQYNEIVDKIGLSKRRIEQRFLSSVGVSMGSFARITRFERVLEMMVLNQTSSLTHIGLTVGYYDQSHFIRDFKYYTDLTPSVFLQSVSKKNQRELEIITL